MPRFQVGVEQAVALYAAASGCTKELGIRCSLLDGQEDRGQLQNSVRFSCKWLLSD